MYGVRDSVKTSYREASPGQWNLDTRGVQTPKSTKLHTNQVQSLQDVPAAAKRVLLPKFVGKRRTLKQIKVLTSGARDDWDARKTIYNYRAGRAWKA